MKKFTVQYCIVLHNHICITEPNNKTQFNHIITTIFFYLILHFP